MDDADRADWLQTAEVESVLAARVHARPTEHNRYCANCGEEIPAARRAAVPGAARCVMCQLDEDRRQAIGV